MQNGNSVRITYRHLQHSVALEALILQRAQQLDHHYPGIRRCEVIVGTAHAHNHRPDCYQARLEVDHFSGKATVDARGREPYHLIQEAFGALGRRLKHLRQGRSDARFRAGRPGKTAAMPPSPVAGQEAEFFDEN